MTDALSRQVAGSHYKDMKIQPVEYIHANGIPFVEGCIIKYVSRWRAKGGVKDLEKALHFVEMLIQLEAQGQDKGKETTETPAPSKQDFINELIRSQAKIKEIRGTWREGGVYGPSITGTTQYVGPQTPPHVSTHVVTAVAEGKRVF